MLILIVNHKEDEFARHTLMISLFPGCIRGWSGLRATSSPDDDLTRDVGEGDRGIVNSDINIRDIVLALRPHTFRCVSVMWCHDNAMRADQSVVSFKDHCFELFGVCDYSRFVMLLFKWNCFVTMDCYQGCHREWQKRIILILQFPTLLKCRDWQVQINL